MDLLKLLNDANFVHSQQVAKISEMMAEKAGYSQPEIKMISQAALFHDIGKAAIPLVILNKPSALTPDEYEIIKTHTAVGCKQITEAIQILTVAAILAQQHHEHAGSGLGYYRMAGADIHPYAKLVAVADVYDALVARRPYKAPWCAEKVKGYFTEQSGKQFEPEMVTILFGIWDEVQALHTNIILVEDNVK